MQQGKYAAVILAPMSRQHEDERAFTYIYGMALLQDKQTAEGLA